MDEINQILFQITELFMRLHFKKTIIGDKTNYKFGNVYCIPHYIESLGFLIEYADSLEEAKKNFHDDGDVFPLSMGRKAILSGIEKELWRDVLEK